MPATKTPSMHHPQRGNVTTSMVGLKHGHMCKNLTQNGEPQRCSLGTQKRKKKKPVLDYSVEIQTVKEVYLPDKTLMSHNEQ